jgi:Rhodanese-like domain
LNAVAAPLAGDSGVGVVRFLVLDAAGVVIWSSTYIGLGYLFSDQLEMVLASVQRMGSGLSILVAGMFAAWIVWKFVQRRRFLKQLEGARISPEELRERIDAGEDLYIVDLRSGLDNDVSSIPGAIRLKAEELHANSRQIPRDREIILFCS